MIHTDAVHCRTCMFWRAGGAPVATNVRVPDANPDLGACEYDPPTVHLINGSLQSMFPAVHADRSCAAWASCDGADGPDGGSHGSNVIPVDFGSAA